MPLGRVLGLLLDRHASVEPGRAMVVHQSQQTTEEVRLFWHSTDVWRMERRDRGVVSDGAQVQSWRGRIRHPPHAARPGHPEWHFQLVFPLRAPVYGRVGDDYFPVEARSHEDGVLVALRGMDDDRQGHLLVDPESGFIREASYLGGRTTLRLTNLHRGPLSSTVALFCVK